MIQERYDEDLHRQVDIILGGGGVAQPVTQVDGQHGDRLVVVAEVLKAPDAKEKAE